MSAPIKVAIVGGGCAAMAAAFELTRPEHGGRYEVTVHQVGWRLGGKGASGRGPANRIEEHGLHLWMGWYENAFRLMRECYAELGRDRATCPIAEWTDAFAPLPLVGIADQDGDGAWSVWQVALPPTEGMPGDPGAPPRWSVRDYLLRAASLVGMLLRGLQDRGAPAQPGERHDAPREAIVATIGRLLRYGELATLAGLVQATAILEIVLGSLASYPENLVLRFVDAIATNAASLLESRLETEPALRRAWHVIDLTLATLRGGIRFRLTSDPRGFDAIDEFDCREWLRLNGASEAALASGYLRALYDFGFSYEDGDPGRPRIAAGQALRATMRAYFTYRGAFFWRMNAGMGDVVFAPFYEALKRRGVRFRFFHRLTAVHLAPAHAGASPHVAALDFDVQADVAGGREYRPLVDVQGLPCWPAVPDWSQLADGARLAREGRAFESHQEHRRARTRTLRVTEDFDLVVLGVGAGAIPYVCRELVERDPRWRAMVDHVKTVATQAFQIWLDADMRELGWTGGPITLSGFTEPFDTWADMRHLLPCETWTRTPRALAYFCNVLPDAAAGDPAAAYAHVRREAVRFLNEDVAHLWPRAAEGGRFRWELLATPDSGGPVGPARFATQFWTANVNPSDRYALSLPGSSAYRISPLDRTYDNLTVAGDWTSCGFNAGCVEAAVMSGRLAAHAIAESPRLEDIVGYDHP